MKNAFLLTLGIATGTVIYQLAFYEVSGVDFAKACFIGIFSFCVLLASIS